MATKKSSTSSDDAAEPDEAPASTSAQPVPGNPPDPPARTIADEQRERSEEIQRIGIEAFQAKFDTRDPDAEQKTVPGVAPNPKLEAFRR